MPQAGDYFVVKTGGWVASVIRLITHSPVNHAGVYVGAGRIIEAQPGGAALAKPNPKAIWSTIPLSTAQRVLIVSNALALKGTPYGFLDIASLAYTKLFGRATPKWVRRRVERTDRLICSQLVDLVYLRSGVHLFSDGRPTEDVTPGDLYELIESEW